ncbi:hypothetical protein [Frankia sp. Cppng1_Ct_nod]|uniref:hypothetical protein n=1 Tax=Frankia sp. Cppng1_Ct_nod TaxID=2897162 RepID=UPI001041B6EF|nr:hypothetical protein [Frankia sp. Cppng1_Ct_nod]
MAVCTDAHRHRDYPVPGDDEWTDRAGNVIENCTPVMTFGSSLNHWTSATVDAKDPQVFSFHQHIVPANLPTYKFNS